MDSFGARLRRLRRAAGLTQENLAEKSGLSGQAVGALERGDRRYPQRATLERLADALGLDGDERAEFTAAATRPGNRGREVPRELPGGVAAFTGREAELERLLGFFGEPRRGVVVAIAGMAGIGKTALALEAGHRLARRFPDGSLHLDLRGHAADPPEALDLLDRLIRELGGEPPTPLSLDSASARFRSLLAGKRVLLLLDNARDAAHVTPLLPGAGASAAIVTSRAALTELPQAHRVQLDVLPEADALRLLAAEIGAERVAAEPAAARVVAALCGYLPLALHLAGARLATRPAWPLAHLAHRLGDESRRLDETGVRTSFALALDALDPAAAHAYPLLSLLDVPELSVPVASRLVDVPERETEALLDRLTDEHLLTTPAPGWYRLHDLLRLYAREHAARLPAGDRAAAITRVVELCAAMAWQSMALVAAASHRHDWAAGRWAGGGGTSADEVFGWLDRHQGHLVTVVRQAAATPGVPAEAIAAVGLGLFEYHRARARWRDAIQVDEVALRLVDGVDPVAAATLRNDLGLAEAELAHGGEAADFRRSHAHLRRSLADWEAIGDPRQLAGILNNLCFVYGLGEDVEAAIGFGERSLALNRSLGLRHVETLNLVNLGVLYGRQGDRSRELAYAAEAVAVGEETDDLRGMAYGRMRIGIVHRELGSYADAVGELRRSAELWQAAGVRLYEAMTLAELGRAHLGLDDRDRAREVLTEALTLLKEYGGAERADAVRAELERL
ncbi:helix-turn-helix domain-containing protein [Amycolatopsis sp. OK19-0408]|uniref:Helix-turn-helix domain-containing protein n=1 Tax=Amycolatopsis iheyensis TaxID=2945988 RepID=A0A9X2SI41_9PSEU|nr:helix-turn-helix domain-containing protein [Amycolatopsis iheyensis]MCR6482528.1 helix-turn-helix domain-containing protein [Amycolatopsis iheyensis]